MQRRKMGLYFSQLIMAVSYTHLDVYKRQVYTPVVKESEYIGQESNSFLERYYDGDITAMLSAYIENDRLSETEIDLSLIHIFTINIP